MFLEAGLTQLKVSECGGSLVREVRWELGTVRSLRKEGDEDTCYQSILPENEEHAN